MREKERERESGQVYRECVYELCWRFGICSKVIINEIVVTVLVNGERFIEMMRLNFEIFYESL